MKTASPNQISLFDAGFISKPVKKSKPRTGDELKKIGQESVVENEDSDYKERFYKFVQTFERGFEFSSDSIIAVLGMPPNNCNSVGGLMGKLARKGLAIRLKETIKSTRPSAHNREINLWRKL